MSAEPITTPLWPIRTDDSFRQQQIIYWTEQADLMRADGNEPLAAKCERNAAAWVTRGDEP